MSVHILTCNGADLDSPNNKGQTPLHTPAASNGHLDVVKFLVKSGANFNICSDDGKMPLDPATDRNMKLQTSCPGA